MEHSNENIDIADNAITSINHLKTSLAFIEACFKHLPHQKLATSRFTMSYHSYDEEYATGVDNILLDLIRCVHYQLESNNEIDIASHLNIRQNILLDGREIELHFYGQLQIYDVGGWIMYCEYFPYNFIRVDLDKETSGEILLELFENLQAAIMNQIERSRDIK